jgi:AraC family transcriptional regulator of adaptative response/methylated-DNA-[protein]-cysteine methyltransferase
MESKDYPLPRVADEDACWQAVLSRDAHRDGTFVYGVRSTGVYCRPSCPSRRPRRGGVVFFPLPEVAERCGYRPCRRCRPGQVEAVDPHVEIVRRMCRHIEANLEEPLRLTDLAEQTALSSCHLQRVFKRITGITPRQYTDACRLGRLKSRLRQRRTVTMALYEAGYGSSSRLYERASSQLGMTPATYQRDGPATHIRYTIASCALGRILLAATERGICAVCLGDADDGLEQSLASEFPVASTCRADNDLKPWLDQILAHLHGHQPHLDLPLDVRATAFQWRVWQELRAIPYGCTRTYQEVARALGQPQAARAVARACATNPVAILVPCHRVVRGDGTLGGYFWGLERKRLLLEQEQRHAPEGDSQEGAQP